MDGFIIRKVEYELTLNRDKNKNEKSLYSFFNNQSKKIGRKYSITIINIDRRHREMNITIK